MSPPPLPLRERVLQRFRTEYGGAPQVLCQAPGRINLIGCHVDYHGGPVLPTRIDRGVVVAAGRGTRRALRLVSGQFPGSVSTPLDSLPEHSDGSWAAYLVGVVRKLSERYTNPLPGIDLAVEASLPAGAGLSSSAALLVAATDAVAGLLDLSLSRAEVAATAHAVETGYVGVLCGIMDPYASALCSRGSALFLDCSTRAFEAVPLPRSGFRLCVLDSMARHDLKDGGYNQRVRETRQALASLQAAFPGLQRLAQLTPADLRVCESRLDERAFRRVRHVVEEIARVHEARRALTAGDLVQLGALINASHASARDLYEISTPRLDCLQTAAREHPGVYGARVTGAGFGGCVVALTTADHAESACRHVAARFHAQRGEVPTTTILDPHGAVEDSEL